MRIAVIGREGQLARSLVERGALLAGTEVVAVGRPDIDLAVPGSASGAIARVRPDLIINAAAYTAVDQAEEEPELAFRINADAAGEIAAAAARIRAAMIHISTDYVFDGRRDGPYTEQIQPNPLGAYGRSKLAGEKRVRDANDNHVIVRTAWVYSPFGRNFVKTVMDGAKTRDTLTVVGDQVGSPSSALDLADGLLRAAQVIRSSDGGWFGEVYHLAGTGRTSWYGLAEFVMAECRKHDLPAAAVRPIRSEDWPTKAQRPANSVLDSGTFERTFGFAMPEWRQSVAEVVGRLARPGGAGSPTADDRSSAQPRASAP